MKKIITFLFSFFFLIKITYALENISINNLDLIPNFDKNIKVYNIYTSKNTEIITINTVIEANETVTGGGSKSLKKGLNVFTINSYFDNKLNKVYTLYITRGEETYEKSDAHLDSLEIENVSFEFESDKFEYVIETEKDVALNKINYLSRNPNSVVNIKTNKDLDENKNEIIVKVTSEDKKNKNTYKILINTRSDSEKISSKKSIFDNKNFDEVDLKIIRIAIISVIVIGLGIIFYFIFIKKRPNKDLCISRNILRK